MNPHQIEALEVLDQFAVSEFKVQTVTGLSEAQIEAAVSSGDFPRPVMELNGAQYWKLGDMFRHEQKSQKPRKMEA